MEKIVYRIEVENEPHVFGTTDEIFDYLSKFDENLKVFICPGVEKEICCQWIIGAPAVLTWNRLKKHNHFECWQRPVKDIKNLFKI